METIDVIDVGEFVRSGREVPRGRHYKIQVNRQSFVTNKECLTGKEILELAGKKPPERYQLVQHFRFGRTEVVELDEKVDLATCGVEKFTATPKGVTEGRPSRQDFLLSEHDNEYLASAGYSFETIKEGNHQWLILRELPMPNGYNVDRADVAILIPPAYPSTPLDMAYFFPALQRADGRPIGKLTNKVVEGKNFQRWSRHRTPQNPWKLGEDDVSSHLAYMNYWLVEELKK